MSKIGWDPYGDRYTALDRIIDERRAEREVVSPKPWAVEITKTPSGESVKIVDARGGVVALVKNGGGRKRANAERIVSAVNHDPAN